MRSLATGLIIEISHVSGIGTPLVGWLVFIDRLIPSSPITLFQACPCALDFSDLGINI